jgi:hypothetical protein
MSPEGNVAEPVTVADNGVRSFVPPTFCFELRDGKGELVATVSQIVMPGIELTDFDLITEVTRAGALLTGTITPYDAGPTARRPGSRFTITDVVPA